MVDRARPSLILQGLHKIVVVTLRSVINAHRHGTFQLHSSCNMTGRIVQFLYGIPNRLPGFRPDFYMLHIIQNIGNRCLRDPGLSGYVLTGYSDFLFHFFHLLQTHSSKFILSFLSTHVKNPANKDTNR